MLIPRITIESNGNQVADARFHDLEGPLVAALKDYVRAGKPVLACFGPRNLEEGPPDPPDELEKLLGELGLIFSKRTVLFEAEKRTFTGKRQTFFRARPFRLPPLDLKGSAEQGLWERRDPVAVQRAVTRRDLLLLGNWLGAPILGPLPVLSAGLPETAPLPDRRVNPIRGSLNFLGECLGSPLHPTLRKPRPVQVDPTIARKLKYETTVLSTVPAAWNDDNPFPAELRPIPRFERATGFDPDAGTLDEKRQGAFPVMVAFETTVPQSWLTSASEKPETVRLAAIGSGSVFTGKELSPAQELLLLDSCNFLLRRKDRLASPGEVWSYPRVTMEPSEQSIWLWSCRLGLPVLFAYFGAVVLLFRRLH